MGRYYIDTCVWRDFYEDRVGPRGRPLGEYAAKLIMKLISDKEEIIISNAVFRELEADYSDEDITIMLDMVSRMGKLVRVRTTYEEADEANVISKERNLPKGDALHAVVARDNEAIIVSQDKHFQKLKDIVGMVQPEELI